MSKYVIISGAAGFIGSCFVWKLNQEGLKNILVVDEKDLTDDKKKNLSGKSFVDYIDKDALLKRLRSKEFSKSIDSIVHIGACASTTETDAAYLKKNNYGYSRQLAEWCLAHKRHFLYASSAATYGNGENGYSDDDRQTLRCKPLNLYGKSKQMFDEWVIHNKLHKKFVGFKFFNVYGPNEYHKADMRSMVLKGYLQIKEKGSLRLFKSHRPEYKDGEQQRDFVYVKDAINIIWYFLKHPDKGGIYNVGTGKARTWNDLAFALFSAMNLQPNIDYFEMPEILRGKYQYFTQAEINKLRAAGYKKPFYSLEEGIKDYVSVMETTRYL